jgi:hypothetical protein
MTASPKGDHQNPSPRCRVDGKGIVAREGRYLNLLYRKYSNPLRLSDYRRRGQLDESGKCDS